MNNTDYELIETSMDEDWGMYKKGDLYYFINLNEEELVQTPKGNDLSTSYRELADRLLSDLETFGSDYCGSDSSLAWQYSIIDNFLPLKREEIVRILDDCFLKRADWTLDENDESLLTKLVFNNRPGKRDQIHEWLTKCTYLQLTAACSVANAYQSLNIAYELANNMEKSTGVELDEQNGLLADTIALVMDVMPVEVLTVFELFELFYGIHLRERGNIINC